MASVSKRKWTHKGVTQEAWMVRYKDQAGKRRAKTFDKLREAKDFKLQVETEIKNGVHTPSGASARIAAIADLYIASLEARWREGRGIGQNMLVRETGFIRLHVVRHFGARLLTDSLSTKWKLGQTASAKGGPMRARAATECHRP